MGLILQIYLFLQFLYIFSKTQMSR